MTCDSFPNFMMGLTLHDRVIHDAQTFHVKRMTDPPTSSHSSAATITAAECWLVGTLVLCGVLLRCWQPSHMAVEHFDEGVYASNLYSPEGSYPFRHLYAPPLLPALLEWALILSGGAAGAVMVVNVIAGSLLLPSVWWVARQWFGPAAGLAAAALACFSDVHILYSRTALTDGLLCLWLLWAVYWAWRAITLGTPASILLAGLFACLAWWTKYNGWLALAISGAGMVAWLVAERSTGFQPVRETDRTSMHGLETRATSTVILRWLGVAAIAIGGWVPYLLSLGDRGGYTAVAANHALYFVGLEGWWYGLLRQTANLQYIESWWSAVGQLAALVLMILTWRLSGHLPDEPKVSSRQFVWIVIACNLIGVAVVVIALAAGTTGVLLLVSLVGLAAALRKLMSGRLRDPSRRLAVWLLAAWLMGLLVAVPLYHPYPRLTLPLVVAFWLGFGLALSLLRPQWLGLSASPHPEQEFASQGKLTALVVALVAAAAAGLAWQSWRIDARPAVAWEDRRGLQQIATEILSLLPDDEQQFVYVMGEPGLFFHLGSQSTSRQRAIVPGSDLASLDLPPEVLDRVAVYAIAGPHANRAPADPAAGISWAEAHARPVREWPYHPSTLVLLNNSPPANLSDLPPETVRLLRIAK